MTPNGDQLTGALRTILAAIGGIAVGKGWIDADTAAALGGGIAILLTAIWSYVAHSQTAQIRAVNAADNGVKVVPATSPSPQVDAPIPLLAGAKP